MGRLRLAVALGLVMMLSLPALAVGKAFWQGYAGDFWNTASSPYAISETDPLAVLWRRPSR